MKKLKQLLEQIKEYVSSHRKQAVAIVCAVLAAIVLIILLALRGCAGNDGHEASTNEPSAAVHSSATNQPEENSSATGKTSTIGESSSEPSKASDAKPATSETSSSTTTPQADAAGDVSYAPPASANDIVENVLPSAPSNEPASSGGTAAPEKHWVVDYVQVWVEDSAAWDETIPLYDFIEKSICNVCGSDITGNETAHSKAHMLAGEGSGHHTEVIQTVIGSNTIHHDATGHYETVEAGGHWE